MHADDTWQITPRSDGAMVQARELWQYRRLLGYFATRALEKSYRRTVLGVAWLFIRPIAPLLLGTLVFGNFIGVDPGPVPYPLFFLVGHTGWKLFSAAMTWATRSLELNRKTLSKQHLPWLIVPIGTIAPALVDFVIHVGLFVILVCYYRVHDSVQYATSSWPVCAALAAAVVMTLLALGIGLFASVFATRARDIRFTLNYVLQGWFCLTPVLYPVTFIPEKWRWLSGLNPMSGLIETFRWGLLGIGEPTPRAFALACAVTAAVLISGMQFFVRARARTVDAL